VVVNAVKPVAGLQLNCQAQSDQVFSQVVRTDLIGRSSACSTLGRATVRVNLLKVPA
jgi:hypothetical protein